MSIYSKKNTLESILDPKSSYHKISTLINPKTKRILDIGCSSGYFGKYLKEKTGAIVWGIDKNKKDIEEAKKNLNYALHADIENTEFWKKKLFFTKFDTIILADILEHLNNPQLLLKRIKKVLKTNGEIIISIPNVTHQSIIMEIISGQWNLEKSGILDQTHLHFFDYNQIVQLIEKAGFCITKNKTTTRDLPDFFIEESLKRQGIKSTKNILKILNKPHAKTYQYIIRAQPKKVENYQSYCSKKPTIKPVSQWIDLWTETIKQIPNLEKKIRLINQISLLKKENAELKKEVDEYFNKLNQIYHSKTWKFLHLYKQSTKLIRQTGKRFLPISTRKKIVSISQKIKPITQQNIEPSILLEWKNSNKKRHFESFDIINFSVISWDYRFQRPQQLATQLSKNNRVFYIKNEFIIQNKNEHHKFSAEKKNKNIYEITLSSHNNLFIYKDSPGKKDKEQMISSIKDLIKKAKIINPVAKIDHPFWAEILNELKMPIIYDCMDYHQGFKNSGNKIKNAENKMFKNSDLVLVSSNYLKKIAKKKDSKKIISLKNAGDHKFFSTAAEKNLKIPQDMLGISGPIIGYYGAIAEWFDTEILNLIAQEKKYSIVLIGRINNEKVVKLAQKHKNIYLLGEKPYKELPSYLQLFDVCIIPFILNDLIKATHPVKLFEFFAAGKPVVSTRLPEIKEFGETVYFATPQTFLKKINLALNEEKGLKKKRQKISIENTWEQKAIILKKEIYKNFFPKTSIVMVTYNNPQMTRNAIESILKRSFYPNYELIIVDNKSKEETRKVVKKYRQHPQVKIILNVKNYGFSKGNNIGIKKASGEYTILINNDVLVTPGWISRMIFHLQKTKVALVGPVTNSIGNEAKINITYNPKKQNELESASGEYTSNHWGETIDLDRIAAFCWASKSSLYKKIGILDERFERGMFEDDDFCYRVKRKNVKIVCAEDVFIHHYGGASFSKLKSYQRIFDKNKKLLEKKWNIKWIPHKYRDE